MVLSRAVAQWIQQAPNTTSYAGALWAAAIESSKRSSGPFPAAPSSFGPARAASPRISQPYQAMPLDATELPEVPAHASELFSPPVTPRELLVGGSPSESQASQPRVGEQAFQQMAQNYSRNFAAAPDKQLAKDQDRGVPPEELRAKRDGLESRRHAGLAKLVRDHRRPAHTVAD